MIDRWLRAGWSLTPQSWRRSAHVAADRAATAAASRLLGPVWRKGRPVGGALLVAGLFSSSTGLGQGARLFLAALRSAGVDAAALDVTEMLKVPRDLMFDAPTVSKPGGVVVSHINPPQLLRHLGGLFAPALRGRRHIGHWVWELEDLPPDWRRTFAYVDEVWCSSRFVADAVRRAAPPGLPVHIVAYPMFMTPRLPADRARWGLPLDACVVLMALDLKSVAARKNPEGSLEAFRRAVPQARADVRLVCKVSGADREPKAFAALKAQLATRTDIVLIAEPLPAEDMTRLVASADVVLSLHRAEGFGLLLAEGMWLGRCVIATGWSGNMDFMAQGASVLTPCRLVAVQGASGVYVGGRWAEPDVDAAATALRALIDDPAARAEMGRRAQAHAEQVFDRAAWLAHVRGLLGLAPQA